jgi:hypothetical protein
VLILNANATLHVAPGFKDGMMDGAIFDRRRDKGTTILDLAWKYRY